jgi:SHS2 domain-containing protein
VGRYRFLDAVAIADCALEVEGMDLDDLFVTAAQALAEVMVDPATVAATMERRVTLTAPSLDLLLYDWLAELILLKDQEEMIFPRVEVRVTGDSPCRLEATLVGGTIDRQRTALRADAKAVTFHQFSIERRGQGWWARVVIDI